MEGLFEEGPIRLFGIQRSSNDQTTVMKDEADARVADFSQAGHQSITELSSSEDGNNFDPSNKEKDGFSENSGKDEAVSQGLQKFSSFRLSCGSFVNSNLVQLVVVCLIVVNALMMGVATFDFVEESTKLTRIFDTADFVFLLIFTLELLLQTIAKGVIGVLSDGWLCFDTIIIIASWSFEHLQIARAFRIVRAIRLATRLEALRDLVQALFKVVPSVAAISGLLLLVIYIWACLCTELYSDYYELGLTDEDYFGRLDYTMFTLFQLITLENWSDIVRQVGAQSFVAWPVFLIFVVITAFILYSLFIAVVCDAVASDNEDEDKMSDSEVREMIQQTYRQIELLTREQIQIQSLCQTCIMYAEKRYQKSVRPLARRRSWLSFLFRNPSRQSLMSDGGQISRRSMPRYEDDSVSSNDSSAYLCLAVAGVQKLRDLCGALVNQPRVQACIVALIAINALMMGLATFDFISESPEASFAFDLIDQLFLIIFTVEIGLQVVYHGLWKVLKDGWMCFDFLVVIGSWAMGDLQIIRSFRIFRAFRLVARLDTLKNLVQALIDVAPSVGAILALLTLIMYIFAVMCTIMFDDLYTDGVVDEDYFGRLDFTFFTLFQFVTLSWADITRQVAAKRYWAWPFFSTFVILTSFILFSLVVAVVCDAVMQSEQGDTIGEKELKVRLRLLRKQVRKLTARQNKLVQLAVKCCSVAGIEKISFANRRSGQFIARRTSSYDLSFCSSGGSLHNEQWHGAYVDTSNASGYDDLPLVSNLELTIPRQSKRG